MTLTRRGVVVAAVLIAAAMTITPDTTADTAPLCPPASHLVQFEDGSGGCYADGGAEQFPVFVNGADVVWPENTFPWDCAVMGNRVCGPQH
jgi:hypothetical protein